LLNNRQCSSVERTRIELAPERRRRLPVDDQLDAYVQARRRKAKGNAEEKFGWAVTLLRKTAQPETLRRLAGSAGREVDDLAAQFFRRPLFVGQRKICRNVKLNQFRHHILLAGDLKPFGSVLKEPPQKSEFTQAHISQSVYISVSSKLNAIYRNTETKREFLPELREKTQVSLSNVRFGANKLHL
jgi:hypothetical protein